MLTRRRFLLGAGAAAGGMAGLGGYAFAVEPMLRLTVAEHEMTPRGWPPGFHLKIAFLSDIHAIEPWMSAERIAGIAALTNTFTPDIVLARGRLRGRVEAFSAPRAAGAHGRMCRRSRCSACASRNPWSPRKPRHMDEQ